MNLTITVEDRLLDRARAVAASRGTSLQELLRGYLHSLAGEPSLDEVADELLGLLREESGNSKGKKVRRGDAYEGRP